jgi:hypothetical protein
VTGGLLVRTVPREARMSLAGEDLTGADLAGADQRRRRGSTSPARINVAVMGLK